MSRPAFWLLSIIIFCGCHRGPRAIPSAKINFRQAAAQAIQDCDANDDSFVSRREAENLPGLLSTFEIADQNSDGQLNADEIQQRLRNIIDHSPALVGLTFEISRHGKPLENATVEMVPEPFLGDAFKSAKAITDDLGMAIMSLSEADLPFPGSPPGVRSGLYRVKITSKTETIAAKYNEATTLGVDVSNDSMTLRTSAVRFRLD